MFSAAHIFKKSIDQTNNELADDVFSAIKSIMIKNISWKPFLFLSGGVKFSFRYNFFIHWLDQYESTAEDTKDGSANN